MPVSTRRTVVDTRVLRAPVEGNKGDERRKRKRERERESVRARCHTLELIKCV